MKGGARLALITLPVLPFSPSAYSLAFTLLSWMVTVNSDS